MSDNLWIETPAGKIVELSRASALEQIANGHASPASEDAVKKAVAEQAKAEAESKKEAGK
ncbi:hypothetical protein ACSDQ9_05780 [Aestuariimicrobium soli]|uniref:hypothetical protein n=1 Tax=Aestuariimicrobium soli TaxID=2035834 RepID=UPI003EB84A54